MHSKVDLDLTSLTWRIKGKPSVEPLPKTLVSSTRASRRSFLLCSRTVQDETPQCGEKVKTKKRRAPCLVVVVVPPPI